MSFRHKQVGKPTVHECGRLVRVIEDEVAPHFVVDGLHMDMCPTCFRNLINDWLDEPWRFWSIDAWAGLGVWRSAVDEIDYVEEDAS